jgi:hypothetical protein
MWKPQSLFSLIYNLFSFFLLLLCWGHNVTVTKVLIIYHSWIQPLHHSPLSPSPPIPGIVSTGLIFPLANEHVCIIFLSCSSSYIFSLYLPPPADWSPRTCFAFLVSFFFFFFKKRRHFCLFNIPIQGVLLQHFHVIHIMHMYYITQISSSPLFFSFLP